MKNSPLAEKSDKEIIKMIGSNGYIYGTFNRED